MQTSPLKTNQESQNNKEQKNTSFEKRNQKQENTFRKIIVKHEGRGSVKDLNTIIVNPLNRQNTEEARNDDNLKKKQSQSKTIELARGSKVKVTLPPIPKHQESEYFQSNLSEIKKASQKIIPSLSESKQHYTIRRVNSPSKNNPNPLQNTIESQTQGFKKSKQIQIIKILPRDPNFANLPILSGFLLQGTVNRIRVDKKQAHNKYQFIISANRQQILTAEPQWFVINSIYHIKQDGKDIAILQSNYLGSRFQLKRIGQQNPLCIIQFLNNTQCDKVRYLKVYLTKRNVTLESRIPVYDDIKKSYTMSFNNRASTSSIKNCILIEPPFVEENIFLLGKINKDEFNLDLTNPLSPLQAFAIAISSFDPKLCCQ